MCMAYIVKWYGINFKMTYCMHYDMMKYGIYYDLVWHTLWCSIAYSMNLWSYISYIMMSYGIYCDEIGVYYSVARHTLWCAIALYGINHDVVWHTLWCTVTYSFVSSLFRFFYALLNIQACVANEVWSIMLLNSRLSCSPTCIQLGDHFYSWWLHSRRFLQHSPTHIVHN